MGCSVYWIWREYSFLLKSYIPYFKSLSDSERVLLFCKIRHLQKPYSTNYWRKNTIKSFQFVFLWNLFAGHLKWWQLVFVNRFFSAANPCIHFPYPRERCETNFPVWTGIKGPPLPQLVHSCSLVNFITDLLMNSKYYANLENLKILCLKPAILALSVK